MGMLNPAPEVRRTKMHPRPMVPARHLGPVNWIGVQTLCRREVNRFLKVYTQTIAAPVVTTLLFYWVFTLAIGSLRPDIGGVPYLEFLAPGLIMMAISQNAFANTSSSVIISKVQGNIVDVLMPPLSAWELAVGYVFGGLTRGIVVGMVTAIAMLPFVQLHLHDPLAILVHGLFASMLLSLFGLIGGIWAEKFDHIAAVTNFLVTPLSFLSGTFYATDDLPETFWWVTHLNPFFYMINGFRYGFIGFSDGNLAVGVGLLVATTMALWLVSWRMLATGYKLKA